LKCAWCMRRLKEGKEVYGLNVTFKEGVDYSDKEGTITQIYLNSRNTSVPMIVAANESEAKQNGIDGIFSICSPKCGEKMKQALSKEIETFKEILF
jgi:hypothetical protein